MDNPFSKAADAVMGFMGKEKKTENIEVKPGGVVYIGEQESQVDRTLSERGQRYGTFRENSIVYDNLIECFRRSPNWSEAPPEVRHALGNIATKLARLLTGDVMYYDNWRDIAGYATLMDKICQGENR